MTTSCTVGLAAGAFGAGPFTKFGKKNCIHVTNLFVIIGCGLQLIKSIGTVLAGRFIFGVSTGAFSVFVPSFINEITPTELKGPYGAITQLLITFGIFIANVLGTPLPDSKTPIDKSFIQTEYWRVLFGLPIVFCIIQSCLLFTVFNYETPKFLKQTGREAELNEIIGKIYSSDQIE
jgi:MFS family permease